MCDMPAVWTEAYVPDDQLVQFIKKMFSKVDFTVKWLVLMKFTVSLAVSQTPYSSKDIKVFLKARGTQMSVCCLFHSQLML